MPETTTYLLIPVTRRLDPDMDPDEKCGDCPARIEHRGVRCRYFDYGQHPHTKRHPNCVRAQRAGTGVTLQPDFIETQEATA